MPRTKNLDLTQGIIWKQLLLFLLPIAAGTLFQQFYSTVDAIVEAAFSAPTPWPLWAARRR